MPPIKSQCRFCKQTFLNKYTLRTHVNVYHSLALEQYASKGNDVSDLVQKERIKTDVPTSRSCSSRTIEQCPLCKVSDKKSNLLYHFQDAHNISIEEENLDFPDFSAFESWKEMTEKETNAQFVRLRAPYTRDNGTTRISYLCSRSGYSKPMAKVRRRKLIGSVKIEGYCPARMELFHLKDGTCQVQFTTTHVGHDLDVSYLRLNRSEKKSIAEKIALDVPCNSILEEFRESVGESNPERLRLLKMQDLYNMSKRSFREDSINDIANVETWIEEMETSGLIRLYKGQGIELAGSVLEKDDFFLVFFDDAQRQMLLDYGKNCICVDGVLGSNARGFQLTAVSVIDELGQGFPVSFLISNRKDGDAIELFFNVIAEVAGELIQTAAFVSDMNDVYYDSWLEVFPCPEKRFFGSWHVTQVWKYNLNKIFCQEKREEVEKTLCALRDMSDPGSFLLAINVSIQKWLEDEDILEFAEYFEPAFKANSNCWAYCYLRQAGINTMALDRMHTAVVHLYLEGKNVDRLDKAIRAITNFVKERVHNGFVKSKKFKNQVRAIQKSHSIALEKPFVITKNNEGGWNVSFASESAAVYQADRRSDEPCECLLKCEDCNACIHSYFCSCFDNCVWWNMCEHIHFVCLNAKEIPEETAEIVITSVVSEDDKFILQDEAEMPGDPPDDVKMPVDPSEDVKMPGDPPHIANMPDDPDIIFEEDVSQHSEEKLSTYDGTEIVLDGLLIKQDEADEEPETDEIYLERLREKLNLVVDGIRERIDKCEDLSLMNTMCELLNPIIPAYDDAEFVDFESSSSAKKQKMSP